MAAASEVPEGLDDEVGEHIAALEERAGKRFGDPSDPLLVSVRSGAAVSMPGMMDTILNLGLNDVAVEGLAASTGNAALRLRLVPAPDPDVRRGRRRRRRPALREALTDLKAARGVAQRRRSRRRRSPRADRDVPARSTRRRSARPFPQDPREQLRRAYRAVFDSWDAPRAQVYRRTYEIPDDIGTAVNVVQMVFGNKGESSGHRRLLHARPVDGRVGALRRVPRQRAGRGRRRRDPHAGADRGACSELLPEAYDAAGRDARPARGALPRHAGHRVHGRGGHGSTCCRRAPGSAPPPPRCGSRSRWSSEGLISREEAVARIDPGQLDQLLHPMIDPSGEVEVAAHAA